MIRLIDDMTTKANDIQTALAKGEKAAVPNIKRYLEADIDRLVSTLPSDFSPNRLGDMQRHLRFGEEHDYIDIINSDLPAIRLDIVKRIDSSSQLNIPTEISESIERFRRDFPNPEKVAFVMMQFNKTQVHQEIYHAIRRSLTSLGITGLRADSKQYHDDLFSNVLTYIYGCKTGIAVFERIESDNFNPNVSLEVGYMKALGKPVCLLKDRTLKTLHTDLVGKLYQEFDPQSPEKTIPAALSKWFIDRGLMQQ